MSPQNSKNPALVLATPGGVRRNQTTSLKEGKAPMAITIQASGRVRPHLTLAGDTTPGIEVTPITPEGLAKCLNALREGELAPVDEVTVFEVIVAAAFNRGFDAGQAHQRELAGVS